MRAGKELLAICRMPLFGSETTPAIKVLELFKKSRTHIALVIDKYGSVQALVTFGDILRSVFEDVEDAVEGKKEIDEREYGSLLISSSLPLDEFTDYLEEGRIRDEERSGMNPVGGFAMAKIGTIPAEGQHFEWRGLRIEVIDMVGRRVDKVLVEKSG